MDGVLVVDKPAGPTSHDVVARARRVLGTKRIGHTGTLDPLATGVLPLVIGRATRLAQFLASEKEYLATVRFGVSTPTYDAEGLTENGARAADAAVNVNWASIAAALHTFRGTYLQAPPPYSAKKIDGIPAYRLARSRKPVEPRPVEVTVLSLELVGCDARTADVRILCTGGFYVRTLAHELGLRLGCGAYLERLRRLRAGDFTLRDAIPLDQLEGDTGAAADRLFPIDRLLTAMPAAVVSERGRRRAVHGNSLGIEDLASGPGARRQPDLTEGMVRLMDSTGRLLGIARRDSGGLLHPSVVLV
jgi:tRNA pseudouridine55 synthase